MKKVILVLTVFLLLFTTPVIVNAAQGNKPVYVTAETVQGMINSSISALETRITALESSIQTLTTQISEMVQTISGLETSLGSQANQVSALQGQVEKLQADNGVLTTNITDLQKRVTDLENKQPPAPIDFTFFDGSFLDPVSQRSQSVDVKGYSKVSFGWQCTDETAIVNLAVSPDNVNWVSQYTVSETQCSNGGSISLPVAGRYYLVSTYTTRLHLAVVAFAHFSN